MTQIEMVGQSAVQLPISAALSLARVEGSTGAHRLPPEPTGVHPASVTQKARVASTVIDPAVTEPRRLLKPFGIEMWPGMPEPEVILNPALQDPSVATDKGKDAMTAFGITAADRQKASAKAEVQIENASPKAALSTERRDEEVSETL